ncbi:MAG: putative methyltransferase [Prokaryotic dsDNA virus sp.]|nr:MAG: putative methyltransferase [Prokaryotic dsDNA virus sp.]|tara:strand:+ start:50071 stop:50655 length:585 start_codon:yes stop_codon:yes gene_type:complete
MKAELALKKCLSIEGINTVLDYGAGAGVHTRAFLEAGKTVTGVDIFRHSEYPQEACLTSPEEFCEGVSGYDLIWASHVLEHIPNPIGLLSNFLHMGEYTCITVPPLKHQIVSGHVNLYNMGLLVYHMVLAGYDMSEAVGLKYGYNISVFVKNKKIENFPALKHDRPDLDTLKEYFPASMCGHGFNGSVDRLGSW